MYFSLHHACYIRFIRATHIDYDYPGILDSYLGAINSTCFVHFKIVLTTGINEASTPVVEARQCTAGQPPLPQHRLNTSGECYEY